MTTPVVFVHGTRTSSAIWEPQEAELASRGVPFRSIDLPGHGTRIAERFTLAGALEAIDEAVDQFDTPPLLVGLSLGGYASMTYASRHPEKVAGLMAAACSTPPSKAPVNMYRRLSGPISRMLRIGGETWGVVTDMLTEVVACKPLREIAAMTMPVWFVSGSRDPLRMGSRLYRHANRTAHHSIIRGSGHDVNSEAPAAFNSLLVSALESLRPAAAHLVPA